MKSLGITLALLISFNSFAQMYYIPSREMTEQEKQAQDRLVEAYRRIGNSRVEKNEPETKKKQTCSVPRITGFSISSETANAIISAFEFCKAGYLNKKTEEDSEEENEE